MLIPCSGQRGRSVNSGVIRNTVSCYKVGWRGVHRGRLT